MRSLVTSAANALDQNVTSSVALVQLVELAFSTPIYLNTSTWDLTYGGNVYKGAYGLGTVSPVTDKPGELQGLQLEMFGSSANIALALDGSDEVQGTIVRIRTAVIDTTNFTVLDAPLDWVGSLDTMSVAEDGGKAVVSVTAESKGVDLLKGTVSMYSDADQRAINAGDGSMSFALDQSEKPVVWPDKAFFRQ